MWAGRPASSRAGLVVVVVEGDIDLAADPCKRNVARRMTEYLFPSTRACRGPRLVPVPEKSSRRRPPGVVRSDSQTGSRGFEARLNNGGSDMGDLYVESYKKSVTNILDFWNKKLAGYAKQLDPIDDQIAELTKNSNPGDDDKKKLADLKKKRDDIRKQIDNASLSLNVNLKVIEVDERAKKEEVMKLPDWIEGIIKDKGVPLGKDVTLVPDVSMDFKSFKVTKCVINIKWKF
jgi:hypothetical protein